MSSKQVKGAFEAEVEMLSDWHVGTGTGRHGSVDRLVTRDADGLPYVPGKTLTGIWRDACETAARALDEGRDDGPWHAWVEYLFGSQPSRAVAAVPASFERAPRPAALAIRPARLPDVVRRALSGPGQARVRAGLTFVKPGVRIDPGSGRAKDDLLRFEEVARRGMRLTASCEVVGGQGLPEPALALLLAGARLAERVGGKRRRGLGRCRLSLPGFGEADLEAAWSWLEAHPVPGEPPAPSVPEAQRPAVGASAGPGTAPGVWFAIDLRVHAIEPLLVRAATLGNTVTALDFVPGTLLLPHVTRGLAPAFDVPAAVARGDVVVLPATLEVMGARGWPAPLALAELKSDGSSAPAASGGAPAFINRLADAGVARAAAQYKQLRSGFVPADGTMGLGPRRVAPVSRIHNTVDDQRQKPTTDVGGVFAYQAIPAGTVLRTEVRLRPSAGTDPKAVEGWAAKLVGGCRLGKSKKDDYGRARIELVGVSMARPSAIAGPGAGATLHVWAVSDVLVRSATLRPDPSPKAVGLALAVALGVDPEKLALKRSFCRTRRIESWGVAWGLPRPSLVALQGGSCLEFEVRDGVRLEPAALRRVEVEGLGERRAEGFGQVVFDHPLLTRNPKVADRGEGAPATGASVPVPRSSKEEFELLLRVEREVWLGAARSLVLAKAGDGGFRKQAMGFDGARPPASQLGALRTAMATRGTSADFARALAWLAHLEDTKNRSKKWPDGALRKVRALLEKPGEVWERLEWSAPPAATQDAARDLEHELAREVVQMVVDACIRAQQRTERSRAGGE